MAVSAAVAAVVVAAGSAAYSIKSSEDAKSEAKKESKKQAASQQRLLDETKAKDLESEQKEADIATRNAQQQRRRAMGGGPASRGGTILTSPLGIPGNAGTSAGTTPGGATLLGG